MLASLLLLAGSAVAAPLGPVQQEQCTAHIGDYCNPDINEIGGNECVGTINPAFLAAAQLPRTPIGCDPNATVGSRGDACTGTNIPVNAFCSRATGRCTVPAGTHPLSTRGAPCKSRCVNPNAFCSSVTNKCMLPVLPIQRVQCQGIGSQGTCDTGQMCSPELGACVTVGLPCASTHQLWFSDINKTYDSSGRIIVDRCGDVDAGPRLPPTFFTPLISKQPYLGVQEYIQITEQHYPRSSSYLEQSKCYSQGYTTPAGSVIAPWAPEQLMNYVCPGSCNCTFPDCPDVTPDPEKCGYDRGEISCFCALCGPKYNAPIKINFWTK